MSNANMARLLAQIDEQRERITQLEEALGFHLQAPLALNLTPAEAAIFGALFARPVVGRDAMQQAHASAVGCSGDSDPKVIEVTMVRVRRKLRPHGIEVLTIWGQGYRMPDESKLIVKEMFAAERANELTLAGLLGCPSSGIRRAAE